MAEDRAGVQGDLHFRLEPAQQGHERPILSLGEILLRQFLDLHVDGETIGADALTPAAVDQRDRRSLR